MPFVCVFTGDALQEDGRDVVDTNLELGMPVEEP